MMNYNYKENIDLNFDLPFNGNVEYNIKGWKLLEKLYNKNIKYNKIDLIPKKIHFIWLGGKIPEMYVNNFNYWKSNLPDYDVKLWTDKDVEDLKLENNELFHNTQNLGAKSDILRYEILNKFGGIYVDLDFLFIKSFDDILHLEFFAGNGHVKLPEIFNSIIGSKPKSKIILSIVEGLKNKTKIDNSINGVMYGTGPYYITKIFYDNVNENDNVIIFPTKYFFSFPGIKRHLSKNFNNNIDYIKSYMNNNTYCIHLWHTAWQK